MTPNSALQPTVLPLRGLTPLMSGIGHHMREKGRYQFSDAVSRLIRQQSQHYRTGGSNRPRFLMDLNDPKRRINSVQVLLEALARKAAA